MKKRLAGLLDDISASSIAIIGDLMLDEYIIGDSNRISPEAPEPVIEERERIYVPGGAANVAVNAVSIGAGAKLFGVMGDDTEGIIFRRKLKDSGVGDSGVIIDHDRPTSRKTRLIARGNQVLRVDREKTTPLDRSLEKQLIDTVNSLEESVIVISDYAKGVISESMIQSLLSKSKKLIVDPKTRDFKRYAGVFLVTPNFSELCEAVGKDDIPIDKIETEARRIMGDCGIENILVTLGSNGMMLVKADAPAIHIHTKAREVFDVTGAGDTVIATIAASVASGASLEDACHVATIAAGIVVGKHKTATATPREIIDYAFGPSSADKIVDLSTLVNRVAELKNSGSKIVFTNGCFDILHMGHISYLNDSRALGDILIVGVNTDESIRKLKGESRPIIHEEERSHVLAALECIDFVILFGEDTPLSLIKAIRPDILVKGADYTVEEVVGHDVVQSYGGRVHLMPIVSHTSTSDIIDRIRNNK